MANAAPGSEWTPAECDVHPGEIEYGDSGCAKCREESAAQTLELPRLCAYCAMRFHGKEVEGVTENCDCKCHSAAHRCEPPEIGGGLTSPDRPDWECAVCGRVWRFVNGTLRWWAEVRGPSLV